MLVSVTVGEGREPTWIKFEGDLLLLQCYLEVNYFLTTTRIELIKRRTVRNFQLRMTVLPAVVPKW
jgi:hypothetical protein